MSDSLRPHGLHSPWDSPGQNTGVGSCSLLQQIFLTQESNQGLLHCRRILYKLSYRRSPRQYHVHFITMCTQNSLCACMQSHFSCVQLFVTPWTAARQAPLSIGFFRQEYRSGLPCPLPGYLPDPGIQPASLMSPAMAGGFFNH